MILQLNPTMDVYCRKHGDGEALFLIDYGTKLNTVWVVRFPGGIIKHFYSDDIRVYANPMDGMGFDVPDLPDWKPDLKGVRKDNIHLKNHKKVNETV